MARPSAVLDHGRKGGRRRLQPRYDCGPHGDAVPHRRSRGSVPISHIFTLQETGWKFACSLHTPANAANNPASIALTGSSRETGSPEQRPTTSARLAGPFQRSLFRPHRLRPVLRQLSICLVYARCRSVDSANSAQDALVALRRENTPERQRRQRLHLVVNSSTRRPQRGAKIVDERLSCWSTTFRRSWKSAAPWEGQSVGPSAEYALDSTQGCRAPDIPCPLGSTALVRPPSPAGGPQLEPAKPRCRHVFLLPGTS